jgi:hypothetical protein
MQVVGFLNFERYSRVKSDKRGLFRKLLGFVWKFLRVIWASIFCKYFLLEGFEYFLNKIFGVDKTWIYLPIVGSWDLFLVKFWEYLS